MKINKIYVFSIAIIIVSFILPIIILRQDKNSFGLAIYKEVPKRVITADIKNIYLVKAIHDIENSTEKILLDPKTAVVSVYSKDLKNNFEKEIQTLANYGVIGNIILKNKYYDIEISPKNLVSRDKTYNINNVVIHVDKEEYSFEIEEKSGKIISMYIDKGILESSLPRQEILMSYIKYLGLDIIDDWNYEEGWLKSEKADLVVALLENNLENKCIISFHSRNALEN